MATRLVSEFRCVEFLLEIGVSPNTRTSDNQTLLYRAASSGPSSTVKALLQHGVDPNTEDAGPHGTALHAAVMNRSKECVIQLLEAGADVEAMGPAGTPLVAAFSQCRIWHCLELFGGQCSLHYCEECCAKLLCAFGADIEAQDGMALQHAVRNNSIEAVDMLLQRGVFVGGKALDAAAAGYGKRKDCMVCWKESKYDDNWGDEGCLHLLEKLQGYRTWS